MKKKKIIKIICLISLAILYFFLSLFLIRQINSIEIDDISPEMGFSSELINKVDILWVIPKYDNKSIADNLEWCNYILSLNKTLGLHGVTHEFEEFKTDRTQEYLQEGIDIFKRCFGYEPTMFKPPQLAISNKNKKLIKENNLELKLKINQLIHKVYHSEDTGVFSNKLIDFS